MTDKPNQRKGEDSNTKVGNLFERASLKYFKEVEKINLDMKFKLSVGFREHVKKDRKFDLGSSQNKIIVECKSHTWTEGNNAPSAKMTAWMEAMLYFAIAPKEYRKVLFVKCDKNTKTQLSLADYFIKTRGHMIPVGVEIIELDEASGTIRKAFPVSSS